MQKIYTKKSSNDRHNEYEKKWKQSNNEKGLHSMEILHKLSCKNHERQLQRLKRNLLYLRQLSALSVEME
jgi:hypothetical protein